MTMSSGASQRISGRAAGAIAVLLVLALVSAALLAGAGRARAQSGRWTLPRQLTWYWQLQGTIANDEPVTAYDIDGFENSAAEVAGLHSQGKHVICYID